MSKRKVLPEGLDESTISRAYFSELERHSNTFIVEIKSFLLKATDIGVRGTRVRVFSDGEVFLSSRQRWSVFKLG